MKVHPKNAIALHSDVVPVDPIYVVTRRQRVKGGRYVVSVYVPYDTDTRLLAEAIEEILNSHKLKEILAHYENRVPRLGEAFFGKPCRKTTIKLNHKVPCCMVRAIIHYLLKNRGV